MSKVNYEKNSFIDFLNDRIEISFNGLISKKDLRDEYGKYCDEKKIWKESDRFIFYCMKARNIQTKQKMINCVMQNYWIGIKFK